MSNAAPAARFLHCDILYLEFFMLRNLGLRIISVATLGTCNSSQSATFILFHALLFTRYYFIMHHLFTAFIATLLYVSTFVCPGAFLFFLTPLNQNQNHSLLYSTF
jgi:hypothetical protein